MKNHFPKNTVIVSVVLVPRLDEKIQMIAAFDAETYEERRAHFLNEVLAQSQKHRAFVESVDVIRTPEELEAMKRRLSTKKVRPRRRCRRAG